MTQPPKNNVLLQERLERRILHGLSCEWETALWLLDDSYRKLMKKPLFSLRDIKNQHGYWSGEKKEICISRDLVFNHSWESVREVLIHEMAHQLSEQMFGRNHSPHGLQFQEACQILRANPKASGSFPTIQERLQSESPDKEDARLIRIKKLMSLAESKNLYEAESAMLKAHELIEKYNVDLLTKETKRNFISSFAGPPELRHKRDKYHLANLLLDFYFVQGIWVSAFVLEKQKMGKALEISGTIPNVKYALYVHDFVLHYIASQWQKYNKDKALNRHRRTDFAIGIIEGFRSKLDSVSVHNTKVQQTKSLVKTGDPLLKAYVKFKYPYTVSYTKKPSSHDENVIRDGKKIGKKLVISRGITTTNKDKQQLIGYTKAK